MDINTIYYVYVHTFANNTIYVGKGKGYRATHFHHRNTYWTNLYNKYGEPRVDIVLSSLTEAESLKYEKIILSNYKICNFTTCNITEGGDGSGHFHTEAHKAAIKGSGNPMYNKQHKDSSKEKMRQRALARTHGSNHPRAKLANIYNKDTNELIAADVCIHVWAKEHGYSSSSIMASARANHSDPSSRTNKRFYKNIYAIYKGNT